MFCACVKPYVLRRPNPLAAVAAGTRVWGGGTGCGVARGGADGAMGCIPSTRACLVSRSALFRARSQASCGVCVWALRHRNIGLHYYDARRARGAPWAKRATRAARGGERVGRKRRSTRAALSASLERPRGARARHREHRVYSKKRQARKNTRTFDDEKPKRARGLE